MGYQQRAVIYVVLLITCGLGPAVAGTGDWQPEADGWGYLRRIDNIELYRKPVAGSRFPALLARTRMAVPAANGFRVISDYDHFADFVPAVSASRVLAQAGANTWVYQRLGLPMLVADRHYVIQVTDALEDARNGLVRVSWQLDGNRTRALSPADAVLPDMFTGSWRLTDSPDGSGCEAIYTIHVEPGGRLPAWLYSRAAERYVTDVVEAVRERAMIRK
jgi:ribosome-associated toxin RatA of RatAB toxin-antitoxin module